MIYEAYLCCDKHLYPLDSTQIEVPDGTDTERVFRIAAHKLMGGHRVELVPHSPENEISELAAQLEDMQ